MTLPLPLIDVDDVYFACNAVYLYFPDFLPHWDQSDDERNLKYTYKWAEIDIWINNETYTSTLLGGSNTVSIRLYENNTLVKTFKNCNEELYNIIVYLLNSIDNEDFINIPDEERYVLIEY